MKLARSIRSCITLAALIVTGSVGWNAAHAEPLSDEGLQAYLQIVAARARSEGVSEQSIIALTSGLTVNQRVVSLDQAQPVRRSEPPPMAPYLRKHVNPTRIARGRSVYAANAALLADIEQQYGVPSKMLFAIWGHETNYGSYRGNFDLARSLATLAYEGRRRELFERELIALMKMVDLGVPPSVLKGSWAGAFGNPQFLPSVFLTTAVDGDGDGRRNIWNNNADTLASIANYLRKAGWRRGQPWGVGALVPAGFDLDAYRTRLVAPTCKRVHARHSVWKTVSQWRDLGIKPMAPIGDEVQATLFQPDGPGTDAYLLTGNYRVILEYNCSNYYALSVGLLADEITR